MMFVIARRRHRPMTRWVALGADRAVPSLAARPRLKDGRDEPARQPAGLADAGEADARAADGRRLAATSRSGTASAASCSATATTSSSAVATSGRSRATSRSSSSACARSSRRVPSSTARVVIATEHGLDFDLLSLRIHPAASRVAKLAEETPSSFVAFDLLAEGDDDLRELPFGERRKRLEKMLKKARPPIHVTPATTDADVAEQWFERFEGAGLDGVVAKPLDGPYAEGQRTMAKVKHLRTADCVVAGTRVHKDGKGVGSLLLGPLRRRRRPPPRRRRQQLRRAAAGRAGEVPPAVPQERARGPSLAGLGRRGGAGRPGVPHAGRSEPVERRQGPLVGSPSASSWSPRSRTSTSRATGSATRPGSSAGAPTATRPRAPTSSSKPPSPSSSTKSSGCKPRRAPDARLRPAGRRRVSRRRGAGAGVLSAV